MGPCRRDDFVGSHAMSRLGQRRHTNTYSIPSSARASTVGGMVRKRLPGLPTTVILFEPSVGLPTSADGPHPRREGFDDGRLRTMGHRDEIKPVAGQSERMRLHELPAPEFIADDHVAADRNSLSADHGVDRVQLLAEAKVPGLFEGIEIGVDRARDRQPLPPGWRIRIAVDPVIVDQGKTQQIRGPLDWAMLFQQTRAANGNERVPKYLMRH